MLDIGFQMEEIQDIYKILAAIILMGDIVSKSNRTLVIKDNLVQKTAKNVPPGISLGKSTSEIRTASYLIPMCPLFRGFTIDDCTVVWLF